MLWVIMNRFEAEAGSFINFFILQYDTCEVDGRLWSSDMAIRLCKQFY